HPGQAFVRNLQLDAAGRVGLDEVHVLPGNDTRWDLLEQRTKRERRHHSLGEPPDGAPRAHVHGQDVERQVVIDWCGVDFDVVHADDLASVDVDDLLIQQVAFQKEDTVGGGVSIPV